MPVSKGVWGIDIGQCALKALRLEMIDGLPTATAFDYVEHPKILSQPDADPDQLTREAIDTFLSRNPIKHDEIAIGIAGQSGLARFVKLPPVEEKKIADIVRFEAKQQIPFPLDEVVWDFQKIAGGDVMDGFAMETEIGLFAMKRDIIARSLMHYNAAKVEVHFVQMSSLALVNYATYEVLKKGGPESTQGSGEEEAKEEEEIPRHKKRCVVVLDIGTDASNLIITDGGKVIWQRPIPLGGSNFTRALTKEMKLTFAKAEHLKRNAAKSPDLPSILKALKPVLSDFVGEVQRSLGYFTNTHRDAHVVYLVGLGSAFRLPGLQKYLAEKLQLDVRKPAKYDRLAGDAVLNDPVFSENVLSFPVAYGLALQGIGQARLMTNLLPQEIRMDRMIRAKKPYAVAAAAALLIGTAGLSLGYSANYASLADPKIETAMQGGQAVLKQALAQETKFKQKLEEVKQEQRLVKAIIAGQDERLNWVRENEVFTAEIPRPGEPNPKNPANGGNLVYFDGQRPLWETIKGKEAFQKFLNRMAQGMPIEAVNDDDLSGQLAMVNIEAVFCEWTDNLPEFFKNADKYVLKEFVENIAERMKDNEREPDPQDPKRYIPKADGSGWVFEVRGYTNFESSSINGKEFILKSLVKNLQETDFFIDKVLHDENKVGTFLPDVKDPVKGKISHVFPFHMVRIPQADPGQFKIIQVSYLDALMPAVAGAPAEATTQGASDTGGTAGGSSSAPASKGAPWRPLTGAPAAARDARGGPGASPVTPPLTTPPPSSAGPRKTRHEFVIMFVWKEPTPSETTAAEAAGGTPASSPNPTPPAKPK